MTSRKPAHLLLVDDDPGLLKLLGMRLVSEGYSVVTAESGQEGLKVLGREKVDLVIFAGDTAGRFCMVVFQGSYCIPRWCMIAVSIRAFRVRLQIVRRF